VLVRARGPNGALTPWAVAGVLAVPFLVGIAALRGLTVALPIFHSTDEYVYHYPTILRFSHQLPFPDLGDYNAAQTPLFHLLMAYVGKLTGYELWRLRLVEVLISYALSAAVYVLLHRRWGLAQVPALAMTLLFTLSPYVLGSSFRVITDNLATLFIVLALERFERFRGCASLRVYALACVCVGAAILTRQSAAFMLGVGFLYALFVGGLAVRDRLQALVMLGLSAAPAGALFLDWHGLVPPGGDSSSCGLCSGSHGGAGLVVATPELALATIGLYGVVLFAPQLWELARAGAQAAVWREQLRLPLIAAGVAALVLLCFPSRPNPDAAGAIASAARHAPDVLGSSLLYWALVPLSGAVLGWRLRVAPHRWPVAAFLGCFLVGALAIRYPWQKYVDPFAMLALIATVRPSELASRRALIGAAVLALAFVAYTVDYKSHASVPAPHAGVPGARPAA
jgi:4-amino-4-deoxy-L-arabinose transferase-like glycosyltransferase